MSQHIPHVALLIETSRTFGRGVLRGITEYAHSYGPWLFRVQERMSDSGLPDWLPGWKGDGVIARIQDRRIAGQLQRLGIPVVDTRGEFPVKGIPVIETDHRAIAKVVADFFLRAGFRNLAFCGFPGLAFSDRRCAAFSEYLADHNCPVMLVPPARKPKGMRYIQVSEQYGVDEERRMARWLKVQPKPLGVFACNDVRAQHVLDACREHGVRVPEDVAVIGVDNDDVMCRLCEPALTSVQPDTNRQGYEAAAALDALMRSTGKVMDKPVRIQPLRIVERASTNVLAMDDPIMLSAIRFIRDHIGKGIAAKDVLAHVGRSRTDMEHRFHRWLHRSIRTEILRRRLDLACTLLDETGLDLKEIARRAGFSTASHFGRVFREHRKQTPSEHRLSRARPKRPFA